MMINHDHDHDHDDDHHDGATSFQTCGSERRCAPTYLAKRLNM
jgi:hypothetical protein